MDSESKPFLLSLLVITFSSALLETTVCPGILAKINCKDLLFLFLNAVVCLGSLLLLESISLNRSLHHHLRSWRVDKQELQHPHHIHPNATETAKTISYSWSGQIETHWLGQALAANGTAIDPPNTLGAFVHLGKTAGSTLSYLLRNGCHSWVAKSCPDRSNMTQESHVSRLTTYYHAPDFELLRNRTSLY
jgi:hypothetical protein